MNKLLKSMLIMATGMIICAQTVAGESVDETVAAAKGSRIAIDNMRGNVVITGWDKAQVKVTGTLDENAERLIVQDNGDSGKHIEITVLIKKVNSHKMRWTGKGSDLEVFVPRDAHVSFKSVSSNVEISDINNSVEVNTVSGKTRASNLTNDMNIHSVSGDIISKDNQGKIEFSTVSGDIKDSDSKGRLYFKTVSGRIDCESSATEVKANVVSGRIQLALGEVDDVNISSVSGSVAADLTMNNRAKLKFSSVSGSIDLDFAGDINGSFNLKSNAGGRIVNNITSDRPVKAKYGPSSKLFFEQGSGSALVSVSTLSGTIKVSD